MFKRLIAYPTGDIVVYDEDNIITYRKGKNPTIKIRLYEKKGIYGLLGRTPDIFDSSDGPLRDELPDDISTVH